MAEQVQRIPLSESVEVSVIIPHFYQDRVENFDALIADIRSQTFKSLEIIVVNSVSPQGRAINLGFNAAKGDLWIVMDDDSRVGHERVIENLVRIVREMPKVGMAGASVLSPPEANSFQKKAALQFPRFNMPVVKELIDSDMPCHGCAIFRPEVLRAVGMERENILRGLDPDLRVRIRKAGFRVVLVPETWVYHPLPESFSKFVRTFFRNGYGAAYIQKFHPEINYDTDEKIELSGFIAKRPLWYRALRYPVRLIQSLVKLEWIRFSGYAVYVFGYLWGVVQFYLLRISPIKPAAKV